MIAWNVLSGPHVRDDVVLLILLGLIYVAFDLAPSAYVLRQIARGAPDVRLDARGIVWGDDRRRHLSLDWDEVAGVRIWPNPIRLGDAGVLVFDPVAGHHVTHELGSLRGCATACPNRIRLEVRRADVGDGLLLHRAV